MSQPSRSAFGRLAGLYGLAGRSLKDLVSWSDGLRVGHPQIDAQHEAIFNLVGEVSALWRAHSRSDQLLAVIDKLDRVLAAHFRYEEKVLADIRYPGLREHKAEHDGMLGELAAIRARVAGMNHRRAFPEPGWEVMNFMLGVTVGHIVHSDSDYCRYAEEAAEDERNAWPHS